MLSEAFLPQDGRDTASGMGIALHLTLEQPKDTVPAWASVVNQTKKYIQSEVQARGLGSLESLTDEVVESGLRALSHQCVMENIPPYDERSKGRVSEDLVEGFSEWKANSIVPPDGWSPEQDVILRELLLEGYTLGALASFADVRRIEIADKMNTPGVNEPELHSWKYRYMYWDYIGEVTKDAWVDSVRVSR